MTPMVTKLSSCWTLTQYVMSNIQNNTGGIVRVNLNVDMTVSHYVFSVQQGALAGI
jgi:hypothetical protein